MTYDLLPMTCVRFEFAFPGGSWYSALVSNTNNNPIPITAGTRVKAFVCRMCVLCIARRRWPQSGYARMMNALEKNCPFCRAYARLQAHERQNRAQ